MGSPADLTLIRMQADSTLPMASRRNYKGVGDAMVGSPARPQTTHDLMSMHCWLILALPEFVYIS